MAQNVIKYANGETVTVDPSNDAFRGKFNSPNSLLSYYQAKAQDMGTEVEMLDVEGFPKYEQKINPFQNLPIGGEGKGMFAKAGNALLNEVLGAGGGPPLAGAPLENIASRENLQAKMQPPQVSAPQLRALTEISGELPAIKGAEVGAKLGARRGRPLLGALAGAASFGVAGNQGMDWLQEQMGIEPRRENPLLVAAREGIYELTGRKIFGGIPALYRKARVLGAKVDPKEVAEEMMDYHQVGVRPTVAQVLNRSGFGDSVVGWTAKNPFTAGRFHEMINRQYRDTMEDIAGTLMKDGVLPTGKTAGEALQTGLERFDEDFIAKASSLYEDVWSKMEKNVPIPWEESRKFFQEAGSNNPLYRRFGSPKIRQLAQDFEEQFVKRSERTLPGGQLAALEQVDNVDLQTMRDMRTLVGEAIRDWTPSSDYKIREMQKLYGALSDDIRAGVERSGGPDALKAFDEANAYWNSHMNTQEQLMRTIENAMGQDPKKLWDHVSSLTNRGYETTLKELRSRIGANSPEWDKFRRMIIRENLITGSKMTDKNPRKLFPDKFVKFREKIDSDEIADMIFGSPGTKMRRKFDAIYNLSKQMDSVLKQMDERGFTRFTTAELYGPVAMGGVAGFGTYSSSEGDVSETVKNAGLAAIAGLALSAMTSRGALRLMTSPDFAEKLARTLEEPASSMPANLTRLAGTYASMDREEKEALIEWLGNMSAMTSPEVVQGAQAQQKRQNVMNEMTRRSGLAPLPGVTLGGN